VLINNIIFVIVLFTQTRTRSLFTYARMHARTHTKTHTCQQVARGKV